MTKEERRAEKVRMLVQSGRLFWDAAEALKREAQDCGETISRDDALACVFVAHLSNEVQGIRHELAELHDALDTVAVRLEERK